MSKKRKLNPSVTQDHAICCTCLEENIPSLLLIGCSNNHIICHFCSRIFISPNNIMNTFPMRLPAIIQSRKNIQCPVCRESINGISNIFIHTADKKNKEKLTCPYKKVLTDENRKALGCNKSYSLTNLHLHIIQAHNQAVQCPNCLIWLNEKDKNMEEMLFGHILKNCQQIPCMGCDRKSNMVSLHMHSVIGRHQTCNNARLFFNHFGILISDYFYMFDSVENTAGLASLMLRWIVQYIYNRAYPDGPRIEFSARFNRLFYIFIFSTFNAFHDDNKDSKITPVTQIFSSLRRNNKQCYQNFISIQIANFSHSFNYHLDQSSKLPFAYRLLMMTLSNFEFAKLAFKNYPTNIAHQDLDIVEKITGTYIKIVNFNRSEREVEFIL